MTNLNPENRTLFQKVAQKIIFAKILQPCNTKNIKFHPPIHVLQMSTKSGEIALDLQISCQNLINTDGAFSLTDPVVTAYSINPESKKREHQIGQTECLSNTLSPVFKKSIKISKSYLASTFTSQSTYIEFDVTDSDLIGNILQNLTHVFFGHGIKIKTWDKNINMG